MSKRLPLLAAFLACLALCPPSRAEEIQVMKSGKYYDKYDAYRVEDDFYLAAKDAAQIYGARVSYHGVSEKVLLSLQGAKVALRIGGSEALVGKRKVELPLKTLLRQNRALIPIAFFEGEAFSEVSGFDTQFNPKTRLLTVNLRSSAGPLRWFTYPDHTRIVLELKDGLAYKAEKRGVRTLDIGIPRGVIEWSEKVEIGDGVVDVIHLRQESKQARLSVVLTGEGARWSLREFEGPRRLVLDIVRPASAGPPPARAAAEPPEDALEKQAPALAAPEVHVSEAPPKKDAPPVKETPKAEPQASGKEETSARRKVRVAIDPGHGGRDSGAVGRRKTLEKDLNLQLAKDLARLLEEEEVFDVLLTRQADTFLPLSDRSKTANEWGADLFISMHCNAHRVRSENGYEIYFLSERASDPEAERLAEFENSVLSLEGEGAMEDEAAGLLYQLARNEYINDASELAALMAKTLARRVDLSNRGVKQASFYVLRGANAPAVLVEAGFLTNSKDETKLESKKYRRKIAEGLYAGILEFARRKDWLERKGGKR
ncbi:MAG TPA: hypothetical protein DCM05_13965 [Elusimicrobia bacterium]|nr:hypothetical protein [Elusimicrobiota bacterium]